MVWTKKETKRVLVPSKSALKSVKAMVPQLQTLKFVKAKDPKGVDKSLVQYEQKSFFKQYKFGVLYVGKNQNDENEIFSNCLYPMTS